MSFEAITYVKDKNANTRGSERTLLFILASMADQDGACYPGITYLARAVNVNDRSIVRLVQNLENKGEVGVVPNAGAKTYHGNTNLYVLTGFRTYHGLSNEAYDFRRGVTCDTSRGDTDNTSRGDTHNTQKTVGKIEERQYISSSDDAHEPTNDEPPSDDDKPDEADTETYHALYEAVAEHVFGAADTRGARVGTIASWLAGKTDRVKRRGTSEEIGYISAPARPEHVTSFIKWWRSKHPDANPPRDGVKFAEWWREFAQSQRRRAANVARQQQPGPASNGNGNSHDTPEQPRMTPAQMAASKLRSAPSMMRDGDWQKLRDDPSALTDDERRQYAAQLGIDAGMQ